MTADGIDNPATSGPTPAAGAGTTTAGGSAAGRQQVRQLAQEFEALLMTQMLRDMRQSLVGNDEDGENNGFGSEALTDTADIELGRSLSRSGGLGLTKVLLEAFDHQAVSIKSGAVTAGAAPPPAALAAASAGLGLAPTADISSATAGSAPGSGAAMSVVPGAGTDPPDPAGPSPAVPLPGPVTSGFGWRQDPITHSPRFHSGVDIAMAYGRDVQAVADGQVVFAGERGGYGNLVVVQHPDGRQTSYGHLSAYSVQAGQQVESGQILGKSGSSGRSTGPHLHFEVRLDGRAVDPGTGG